MQDGRIKKASNEYTLETCIIANDDSIGIVRKWKGPDGEAGKLHISPDEKEKNPQAY